LGRDIRDKATSTLNGLQDLVKDAENATTTQGQQHVEDAKVAGAGYYEQAKQLAGSAIAIAQVWTVTLAVSNYSVIDQTHPFVVVPAHKSLWTANGPGNP
jgi:predicted oxidoreductase